MNKLYNDTAVQAIANAIRAKNGSSDTYTIAEMSTALNDLSYYAKPTISNVALATFEADGLPLNSLKVSVEAKQEGSGTPSPENVRPISGWSEVNVSDVDDVDNPTVTQTTTISLPQTVYGAEVDVVNGAIGNKLTHGFVVFDGSENWTNQYGIFMLPIDALFSSGVVTCNSDKFESLPCTISWSAILENDNVCTITKDGNYVRFAVIYHASGDLAGFKAWLASNPLQVRYELATPTTFTTQPTPIKSLNGQNNLSVDCGEVIELEYFKEV